MTFIQPGEPSPKKSPYARSDAAFEEAQAARHAARERSKEASWDQAVRQTKVWTVSTAADALKLMPSAVQQMYLLAEESTLNRAGVLRLFPAVAPSTREAWAGYATPEKSPTSKKGT